MVTLLGSPTRPLPDPGAEHVWIWEPSQLLIRVYHEHPDRPPLRARTFGPFSRFDPHVRDGRQRPREQRDGRGVTYLAADLGGALAEAFPGQWPEVAVCRRHRAVAAAPRASAAMLDLTGDGAMKIGAVGTLGSGDESRRVTQRWARAIYEDLPELSGIRYRGAHQGGLAVAAWERAGQLRAVGGADFALTGPQLVGRVAVALASQGRHLVLVAEADCDRCRAAGYSS